VWFQTIDYEDDWDGAVEAVRWFTENITPLLSNILSRGTPPRILSARAERRAK
jgi:hypothetical protein